MLRFLMLVAWVSAVLGWAPSVAFAQVSCESAFLGSGDEGFSLPVDPRSMAAREPGVLSALEDASILLREAHLDYVITQAPRETVGRLVDELISQRHDLQSRIIRLWRERNGATPEEVTLVDRIVAQVSSKSDERLLLQLKERHGGVQLQELKGSAENSEFFEIQQHLREHLRRYHSWIHEALVAVTVKGFSALGSRANGLMFATRAEGQGLGRERILKEYFHGDESLMDREIDVVFNEGHAWGEVKNYREPIQATHRSWRKLTDQAKALVRLRELYNQEFRARPAGRVLPRVDELHYFAPHGMSHSAAAELEAIGFVVHAPRVSDESH